MAHIPLNPGPIYAIGGINEHSLQKMPPGFKGICAISYFNNASLEEIKQLFPGTSLSMTATSKCVALRCLAIDIPITPEPMISTISHRISCYVSTIK
jgi:hypothetical protein